MFKKCFLFLGKIGIAKCVKTTILMCFIYWKLKIFVSFCIFYSKYAKMMYFQIEVGTFFEQKTKIKKDCEKIFAYFFVKIAINAVITAFVTLVKKITNFLTKCCYINVFIRM